MASWWDHSPHALYPQLFEAHDSAAQARMNENTLTRGCNRPARFKYESLGPCVHGLTNSVLQTVILNMLHPHLANVIIYIIYILTLCNYVYIHIYHIYIYIYDIVLYIHTYITEIHIVYIYMYLYIYNILYCTYLIYNIIIIYIYIYIYIYISYLYIHYVSYISYITITYITYTIMYIYYMNDIYICSTMTNQHQWAQRIAFYICLCCCNVCS